MASVNEITQNIIEQAKILDPNISLEIGTPERKIVEAVAEAISAASIDIEVLSNQLYLDAITGARLDSFMSIFGFARRLGARSTGVVTISRASQGTYDTVVPKGTQFSTRPSPTVPGLVFVATETVTLRANETRASVRVECTTTGTIGNIPAGTINALPNAVNIPGVSNVTNELPMRGGIDSEDDTNLKVRFQNSIFRNMAGTTDQYLALALSHSAVTRANVIGAQSRYIEYIQIPTPNDSPPSVYSPDGHSYTTSISSVPYSKYTFSNRYYLAKGFGKDAKFLKPGKEFIFNNPALLINGAAAQNLLQNPVPNVTLLGQSTTIGGEIVEFPGNVFLFEHSYLSKASRNDWEMGVYNCVDVYVNGESQQIATSEENFPTYKSQFTSDSYSSYFVRNYMRVATHETPDIGSRLQVLYFQPMLQMTQGSMIIAGTEYYEAKYTPPEDPDQAFTTKVYYNNADGGFYQDQTFTVPGVPGQYFVVEDISENRGTIRAQNGIEWLSSTFEELNGTSFNIEYAYNTAISQLQAVMERSKQITTDVLVHSSVFKYMKLFITVMYTPGFTETNVNQEIVSALQAFFGTQQYGTTIQMSDLLQVIHNTNGVDNVRWTNQLSNGNKVEIVTKDGNSFSSPVYYSKDFILHDDELPSVPDIQNGQAIENAIIIQKKAQNTWESN